MVEWITRRQNCLKDVSLKLAGIVIEQYCMNIIYGYWCIIPLHFWTSWNFCQNPTLHRLVQEWHFHRCELGTFTSISYLLRPLCCCTLLTLHWWLSSNKVFVCKNFLRTIDEISHFKFKSLKAAAAAKAVEECHWSILEMVQDNLRDGHGLKSDDLKRCWRLQDRGAVQGRSRSRQHVVAHRHGGTEARLAKGGIREHEAFLGHEMRVQQGLGMVSFWWLVGGKAKAPGRGKR